MQKQTLQYQQHQEMVEVDCKMRAHPAKQSITHIQKYMCVCVLQCLAADCIGLDCRPAGALHMIAAIVNTRIARLTTVGCACDYSGLSLIESDFENGKN